MSKGDKASYSPTQRRKAEHIEDGYKKRGVSTRRAERIAWSTVNKQDGGAEGTEKRKRGSMKKGMAKSRSGPSTRGRTAARGTAKR